MSSRTLRCALHTQLITKSQQQIKVKIIEQFFKRVNTRDSNINAHQHTCSKKSEELIML